MRKQKEYYSTIEGQLIGSVRMLVGQVRVRSMRTDKDTEETCMHRSSAAGPRKLGRRSREKDASHAAATAQWSGGAQLKRHGSWVISCSVRIKSVDRKQGQA